MNLERVDTARRVVASSSAGSGIFIARTLNIIFNGMKIQSVKLRRREKISAGEKWTRVGGEIRFECRHREWCVIMLRLLSGKRKCNESNEILEQVEMIQSS